MKILYTVAYFVFFITFIIPLNILSCRTHKPFTTDFSIRGLQEKALGVMRIYDANVFTVQEALLRTFVHFGNRVNVEAALIDEAYLGRFSYLISQGLRTQVKLYEVDLHKPMVFRAIYPTYTVPILKIKENIHRVYIWIEKVSAFESKMTKTIVRIFIDEEPPQKEYQISPHGAKYTESQFFDHIELYFKSE